MSNEEKAKEIFYDNKYDCEIRGYKQDTDEILFMIEKMAAWKDKEFARKKQALIDKMNLILDGAEEMRVTTAGREETGGWYWRKWAEWGYRKAMEVMEETK